MARGYPDYANPVYGLASKNIDFGILATARMRIAQMDARGRVIWYDNFQEGRYGWVVSHSGNGVDPKATINEAEIPPASIVFDPGTIAGAGNSRMTRSFMLGESGRVGVEAGFLLGGFSIYYILEVQHVQEGAKQYGQLRLDPISGVLEVNTSSGYVEVGTYRYTSPSDQWAPLKLVVDFVTGAYVRALIGVLQIDLDGYDLLTDTSLSNAFTQAVIGCDPRNGIAAYGYCGHVFFTIDEP